MSFCRVLRPPGGGSSNLFGGYEEDTSTSRRPNKMSSSIFGPPEETQGSPKRSNPPGESFVKAFLQQNEYLIVLMLVLGAIALSKLKSSQHVRQVSWAV